MHIVKLRKVGNSTTITLPTAVVEALGSMAAVARSGWKTAKRDSELL